MLIQHDFQRLGIPGRRHVLVTHFVLAKIKPRALLGQTEFFHTQLERRGDVAKFAPGAERARQELTSLNREQIRVVVAHELS